VAEFRLDRAYPDLFSPLEAQLLAAQMEEPEAHGTRTRLVRAQTPLTSSIYLISGFLGRYTCDRFGRRQFTALQIPGDYADLEAFPLKVLDYDMDALGEVIVRHTPHPRLNELMEHTPSLAKKLWRLSLIDAAISRYWIFRIGRLSGKARVANFLAETFCRLYARSLATPEGYALPLSQTDLAELCGMTPVHLNRMLSELRLDGVCTFSGGRVEISDLNRLIRIGEHTRDYLYLPKAVETELRTLVAA